MTQASPDSTPPHPLSSAPSRPSPGDGRHIALGRSGEDTALAWLLARAYRLVERNYRFGRHGELDLIVEATDGDLVFVEVKTGGSDAAGDPLGWIHGRKQHKIQRIAQAFCVERGIDPNRSMRFDAIAVTTGADGTPTVVHVPHAFLPDGKGYWR